MTLTRVAAIGVLATSLQTTPILSRAHAQPGGPQLLLVEAASVKQNKSGSRSSRILESPGGRLVATNITARELMRYAYSTRDFLLLDGPAWLASLRFDVVARARTDLNRIQIREMAKEILVDRFHLDIAGERRVLPVMALVVAREDGRLGPGLAEATESCRRTGDTNQPIAPADLKGLPADQIPCVMSVGGGGGPVVIRGSRMTLLQLADVLSRTSGLNRMVIDRTGLAGEFRISVQWLPESADIPGAAARVEAPDWLSVGTALKEQLGLELQAATAEVNVLVIRHVEPPTED